MKQSRDYLALAALLFALVATASAEYELARAVGFNQWVAAAVPGALDIYTVRAMRARRDVAVVVAAMIAVNALSHLVAAGILTVSWPLVVAVSAIAPLVLWRVHRLADHGADTAPAAVGTESAPGVYTAPASGVHPAAQGVYTPAAAGALGASPVPVADTPVYTRAGGVYTPVSGGQSTPYTPAAELGEDAAEVDTEPAALPSAEDAPEPAVYTGVYSGVSTPSAKLSTKDALTAIEEAWVDGRSLRDAAEVSTRSRSYVAKVYRRLDDERGPRPAPGQLTLVKTAASTA